MEQDKRIKTPHPVVDGKLYSDDSLKSIFQPSSAGTKDPVLKKVPVLSPRKSGSGFELGAC
ncbi:MAG: hypothetical protein AAF182_00630 [Pseudomonadota bacterium]